MTQLAEDMLAMGCAFALNLDGGGSAAMQAALPGGMKLVNTPSEGALRSCGSYIIFVTDPGDGWASRLFLDRDGAYVLAGSSLDLGFLALDAGLAPVSAPPDSAAVSGGLGSVSGQKYTAGGAAGVDIIYLSSASGGISGSASVNIVETADTVTVSDAVTGKAVSDMRLDYGASLSLDVRAFQYKRSVAMDKTAPSYAVSGEIGTITEEGVFTADGTPGAKGAVTVSVAGKTSEIKITVGPDFRDVAGHWAKAYIDSLYDSGIVTGITPTSFGPVSDMKRCDFLLMLWRAAGKPAAAAPAAFADVKPDAYYAAAIDWAAEKGVALGTGDGNFAPQSTLTREQAFTFVYRALSSLGVNTPEADASLLEGFSDSASVAEYAAVPAAALVKLGIVEGAGGKLEPQGLLTRAQMAKILCMVLEFA